MIGKVNSGLILGILKISCPNNATVTIQNGNLSYTKTGTAVEFKLPRIGTWNITAAYNGITNTYPVVVNPGQTVNVTVLDSFYLYNAGTYITGFARGWTKGETASSVSINATASRNPTSTSNGSVNVTGYRTINAHITGDIGGPAATSGRITMEVISTDGTVLASNYISWSAPEWGGSQAYDTVWVFDVSTINQPIQFRLRANTYAAGSESRHATITLHSIQLIA